MGYAALVDAYRLAVPLPATLSAIGPRHRLIETNEWRLFTPRHAPRPTLEGHLTFALKYEGVDLVVLKRLFDAINAVELVRFVRARPTGSYARRLWFLYEWLMGRRLDLPDSASGAYAPILDPELQWAIEGQTVPRQRVRNNLPGTLGFCPLVFRTPDLDAFVAMGLAQRARAAVASVPRDVLARAAAFLLLKDSRSSYAIEGERPPQDRIQRWGRAIGEAGRHPLDLDELLRLQRIVIGDGRFVRLGLRHEGGFVGQHDRDTQAPLPDHISAKPEDLLSLVDGLIRFAHGPAQQFDAVIAAAVLAFGFVYIHSFDDGNGRIHRYVIHHMLAQRGFNPPGVIFPVSAVIHQHIDAYRKTLEAYSARLLPVIDWRSTAKGNVEVLSDTADYYRFFDATPHAEFLYTCVRQTIERDLPDEAAFLRRYDQFRAEVGAVVDMPDRTIDLLFRFLQQNHGRLSLRAREQEFAPLTDDEAARIERSYAGLFDRSTGVDPVAR